MYLFTFFNRFHALLWRFQFWFCTSKCYARNGHTTSNRCRFHVDIMTIRQRPNFDKFSRHFHVLFRCNFADQKIQVVSTYFFRRNFNGQKIHFVFTYFFRCNFDVRIIHVVCTYFLRRNFDGQKFDVVYG